MQRGFFRVPARWAALLAATLQLAWLRADAVDLDSYQAEYDRARTKLSHGDFAGARVGFERLLREAPEHPRLQLGLADCLIGLGRVAEAEAVFERVVAEGFGAALSDGPAFVSLNGRLRDPGLSKRAAAQAVPIAPAVEAFTIAEPKFIAEGLAYDPDSGRFFAGSTYLRKVIVRETDGRIVDFTPSADHGLLQVLGLKVDAPRGRLMVLTGTDDARLMNYRPSDRGRSGVLSYDLASGRLLRATWLEAGGIHLFNDLVLAPDGSAYLTDSDEGRVYRLSADGSRLTPVTRPGVMLYPNGIDLDLPRHVLYVAEFRGIFEVDLNNGAVKPMPHAESVSTVAVDGLYLHGSTLIGVQGVRGLERIMAFRLSRGRHRIESAEPLERADPRLNGATEGVVVGEKLYFIANSLQDTVDEDGVVGKAPEPGRVAVLALPLPARD